MDPRLQTRDRGGSVPDLSRSLVVALRGLATSRALAVLEPERADAASALAPALGRGLPALSARRFRAGLRRGRRWDVLVAAADGAGALHGVPIEVAAHFCAALVLLEPGRREPPHWLGAPGAARRLRGAGVYEAAGEGRARPGAAARAGADVPVHCAVLAGDAGRQLLRIDDYPTGVRPILADLGPLHAVLRECDRRGLEHHLGIVPTLLEPGMIEFLRGLRHLVPVVHGFDHGYPAASRRLRERDDPFNQRGTVRAFNEFRGQPRAEIFAKIARARALLEEALGRPARGYIPPCNKGDITTGRALVAAGYTHYLSEQRILFCPLPLVRSDFYGRSAQYEPRGTPGVVTLHATWEADLVRNGDEASLPRMLDALIAQQRAHEDACAALAAQLLG
jgi:hypothetical protein